VCAHGLWRVDRACFIDLRIIGLRLDHTASVRQ
jgi:hypothetical protein